MKPTQSCAGQCPDVVSPTRGGPQVRKRSPDHPHLTGEQHIEADGPMLYGCRATLLGYAVGLAGVLALGDGLLETEGAGEFEGHFVGIDGMVFAIVERHFQILKWITGHCTFLQDLSHPLLDRRNELARNGSTTDIIAELKPLAASQRLDP